MPWKLKDRSKKKGIYYNNRVKNDYNNRGKILQTSS